MVMIINSVCKEGALHAFGYKPNPSKTGKLFIHQYVIGMVTTYFAPLLANKQKWK